MQLEALLLLHGNPQRQFSTDQIARELRISPRWAGPQLDQLCSNGVVTCIANSPPVYQYHPHTSEIAQTIDMLAEAYASFRVSVTALIFSKPPAPLRSFADAFRLRKDRPDG